MLVLGLSILQGRLNDAAFLGWWGACFLLTMLAMSAAFLDLHKIRVQSRDQHRKLIETTLKSIGNDATDKRSKGAPPPGRK